jgi:hypothetical protein
MKFERHTLLLLRLFSRFRSRLLSARQLGSQRNALIFRNFGGRGNGCRGAIGRCGSCSLLVCSIPRLGVERGRFSGRGGERQVTFSFALCTLCLALALVSSASACRPHPCLSSLVRCSGWKRPAVSVSPVICLVFLQYTSKATAAPPHASERGTRPQTRIGIYAL